MIEKTKEDSELVNSVLSGKKEEIRKFVESYSPFVMGRIWQWMQSHCRNKSIETLCTLLYFQQTLKHNPVHYNPEKIGCDECIDTYIWSLEYLKNRLKAYKSDDTLEIFIGSVLDSKSMYIDWLRWKYGRAF